MASLRRCRHIRPLIRKLLKTNYQTRCFSVSSNESDKSSADVVISGGGMVGTAMACAIANNKFLKSKRIVLLEAGPEQTDVSLNESYNIRTCALSPATVDLLDSFGAWEEIEKMRSKPVLRMQVWESCSDAMITFNNSDMTKALAYLVENNVIQAGIMKAMKKFDQQIDIRYQSVASSIQLPGGPDSSGVKMPYVELTLKDGSVLRTKLLIGADGMNSSVRKAAGFHTLNRNYNQAGVVATLVLGDESANNTAWQRFLPTGPISLLPLKENLSSMVWTTTPEHARNLKELPEENFVDAVNDALWRTREKNELADKALQIFKSTVDNLIPNPQGARQLPPTVVDVQKGSRASFPLSLTHSSQYVRPRVALIGDAAHRVHPLAGQGVNLGFGDAHCMVDILANAVKDGADLGSLTHLLQYETQRQRQNVPVIMVIDGLQRLYSTDFTPLVVLRSLGLHAVHSMPFLKEKIMGQAAA